MCVWGGDKGGMERGDFLCLLEDTLAVVLSITLNRVTLHIYTYVHHFKPISFPLSPLENTLKVTVDAQVVPVVALEGDLVVGQVLHRP